MSLFSPTRIDCHSRCYICDTSVNNCEEYFVCVICKLLYHFQCSGLTESELKFYNCNSILHHCSTCANSQDSLNEINSKTSTLLSHSETDEDGSHFCNNSLYYNIHETCNIFKSCNTQDALTILHMNIRRLSKNLYKLENFLLAIEHCPDVIAITETKLKNSKSVKSYNLQLEGYDFVHTDTNMNASGVVFLLKKLLSSMYSQIYHH